MLVSWITQLALVIPLAAPAATESAKPAELQGAWRLVSVEAAAGMIELPETRPLLTVVGNRLLFGGEEFARLAADDSTDPKVFDLHFAELERTYEGIYEMQGKDRFQVCLNGRTEGVKERPNSFSLDEQPVRRLLKFERTKADAGSAGNGFIGMALRVDDDLKVQAIVVAATVAGSPAEKAGLLKDDALMSVGGDAVTDLRSAINSVRRAKPKSELAIWVRRGTEDLEIQVKVGVVPFTMLTGLD